MRTGHTNRQERPSTRRQTNEGARLRYDRMVDSHPPGGRREAERLYGCRCRERYGNPSFGAYPAVLTRAFLEAGRKAFSGPNSSRESKGGGGPGPKASSVVGGPARFTKSVAGTSIDSRRSNNCGGARRSSRYDPKSGTDHRVHPAGHPPDCSKAISEANRRIARLPSQPVSGTNNRIRGRTRRAEQSFDPCSSGHSRSIATNHSEGGVARGANSGGMQFLIKVLPQ